MVITLEGRNQKSIQWQDGERGHRAAVIPAADVGVPDQTATKAGRTDSKKSPGPTIYGKHRLCSPLSGATCGHQERADQHRR